MSWPKKTWTQDGWVDFKTPGRGAPSGLPDDWKEYESSVDNSKYWDILENPLYEAAANASGLDWDQWVADSIETIGDEDDYELPEEKPKYIVTQTGQGGNQSSVVPYNPSGGGQHEVAASTNDFVNADGTAYDGVDPDSDLRNWGINRDEHGAVAEDLDTMHSWLTQTIKTHSLQDRPILNRGPEGSDYGIDGDVWEHYGLDKPVTPPKEMDVEYEFNLMDAKPSNVTYSTPQVFHEWGAAPPLYTSNNTHTKVKHGDMKADGEPTSYDKWMDKQRQEAIALHDEAENTSYGEPT